MKLVRTLASRSGVCTGTERNLYFVVGSERLGNTVVRREDSYGGSVGSMVIMYKPSLSVATLESDHYTRAGMSTSIALTL